MRSRHRARPALLYSKTSVLVDTEGAKSPKAADRESSRRRRDARGRGLSPNYFGSSSVHRATLVAGVYDTVVCVARMFFTLCVKSDRKRFSHLTAGPN